MKAKEIIEKAGGSMAVAVGAGVTQSAVYQWVCSNYIPVKAWGFLIRNTDVTLEDLYQLAAKRKKSK